MCMAWITFSFEKSFKIWRGYDISSVLKSVENTISEILF